MVAAQSRRWRSRFRDLLTSLVTYVSESTLSGSVHAGVHAGHAPPVDKQLSPEHVSVRAQAWLSLAVQALPWSVLRETVDVMKRYTRRGRATEAKRCVCGAAPAAGAAQRYSFPDPGTARCPRRDMLRNVQVALTAYPEVRTALLDVLEDADRVGHATVASMERRVVGGSLTRQDLLDSAIQVRALRAALPQSRGAAKGGDHRRWPPPHASPRHAGAVEPSRGGHRRRRRRWRVARHGPAHALYRRWGGRGGHVALPNARPSLRPGVSRARRPTRPAASAPHVNVGVGVSTRPCSGPFPRPFRSRAPTPLHLPGGPRAPPCGRRGPVLPGVPLCAAAVAARPRAPLLADASLRVGGAVGQGVLRHVLARCRARVRLPQPPHRAPRPPGVAHLPDQRSAAGQHSHAPRRGTGGCLGARDARAGA